MDICLICGSTIPVDSNLIIMSNKIEHYFYSKNCVEQFVENPDKYLSPVKLNYDFSKIERGKNYHGKK